MKKQIQLKTHKLKQEKGITLIALIITIVVLMILAAVAINSITNDGIISKAGDVKNTYTEAKNEEEKMLDYYQLVLERKAWIQNGTTVTRGTDTFKVGESVKLKVGTADATEYSVDGYDGDWVVLGVEYGKLLLVSASNVVSSVALGGAYGGNIDGTECVGGYYNGAAALDTICSAYLNTTYADEARSITAEDINRVTGYVPAARTPVTITEESAITNGPGVFMHPDGREIGKNGVISIQETETVYDYQGETYITDTTDPAYVALFNNTSYGSGSYWLASPFVNADPSGADFGLRVVRRGSVESGVLWGSRYGAGIEAGYGARAVVSINPYVQVVKA